MDLTQVLRTSGRDQAAIAHLGESERFRLLADERRRHVLDVLDDANGPIALEELATEVSESETSALESAGDAPDGVLIALHHVHLPMLAEAGVVAYDPATKTVVPTDGMDG